MEGKSETNITGGNTTTQNIGVIALKIDYIQADIKDIKEKLEKHYVTQDQFEPIKKLVYGTVSVVLLSVVTAVVMLVIRK